MKNYYEILEVDKNASQEVIEKAYRALAKKYHPDLQQGVKKQEYAEKMKIINQAYDVLSDSSKRSQYNENLKDEQMRNQISKEQHQKIMQENYILKQQLNRMGYQRTYNDTYMQDTQIRDNGIKFKHNWKYYLNVILIIAIIIFIFFLIYQIPVVKNYFGNLYKENMIFQAIVDIFKNTLSAGF